MSAKILLIEDDENLRMGIRDNLEAQGWEVRDAADGEAGLELALGWKADLILLAMGFVGSKKAGLLEQAGVELTGRGNVEANTEDYTTSIPGVFACGDMRRGQSLVVWAIREGRQAARAVDEALMGASALPR